MKRLTYRICIIHRHGEKVTDNVDIANTMNEYFCKIGRELSEKLHKYYLEPCNTLEIIEGKWPTALKMAEVIPTDKSSSKQKREH